MNPRRLYRSRQDRKLAGVAGGIAEYLEVDPTVIRVLWIISIFFGGFGILLYIIMAFVVPLEPLAAPATTPWQPEPPASTPPPAPAPAPAPSPSEPVADAPADADQHAAGEDPVAGA